MIPNLFKKSRIPDDVPMQFEKTIRNFSESANQNEFLKKSFFFIVKRWGGNRMSLFLNFSRLFETDIAKILNTKGYLHCTTMNYLLRVMAVKSGMFADDDIQLKLTNTWYVFPHQYLVIKLKDRKQITLDPWNFQFGIKYGDYGSGFDSVKLKSKISLNE